MLATIGGWDDLRKRRELYAAMAGAAAKAVADLPVEDPMPPPAGWIPLTFEAVLASYEGRFVTTAASDTARAEFSTARQMPSETILEWHGRLRDLFQRAYPTGEVDQGASGQLLRDRFVQGLDNTSVREYTLDQRPANYVGCLEAAQNKSATLLILNGNKAGRAAHSIGAVSADNSRPPRNQSCFFCQELGHFARECEMLNKAKKYLASGENRIGNNNNNAMGTGTGRGRGRRAGRGGGGRPAGRRNDEGGAKSGPKKGGPSAAGRGRRIAATDRLEGTEDREEEEDQGNDQGRE